MSNAIGLKEKRENCILVHVLTETLGIELGASDGAKLGSFDGSDDGLVLGT